MPSYYKQIKGIKYDKGLLEVAEKLTTGKGDGRISKADAVKLWEDAKDGPGVTDCERRTIQYIHDNFKCTDAAKKALALLLEPEDVAAEAQEDPAPASTSAVAPMETDSLELQAAQQVVENEAVFIDALLYIDLEYSEMGGMKQTVENLIRAEMARFKPKQDYLAARGLPPMPLLELKDAPLIAAELLRVADGQQMDQMDTTRYQLEAPSDKKVASWQAALDNCFSQTNHQTVRMENLELASQHAAPAWKMYNSYLETSHKSMSKSLEATRTDIEQINRKRKLEQVEGSQKLRTLERQWAEVSATNLQIDAACQNLERKLKKLKPETVA